MGRMIDGEWHADVDKHPDDEGYEREETSFRGWIEGKDGRFPAEPNRYHLYVSWSCPWAHRTILLRRLRGLEDVVSMDVVDPVRENDGWEFSPEKRGCTADTVNGRRFLRDVYAAAHPSYTGAVTVPVLWDAKTDTIVNNESREIVRMLDTAFDGYGNGVTLYPDGYRDEIDRAIDELYGPINDGVYRAGFADTQEEYESAVTDLFDALDRWERALDDRRYACGEVLTEADVCLFTTLFRFDAVYHTHFKCTVKRIVDYPNLWNYTKELYQLPGVGDVCRMRHVKDHYYRGHEDLNPTGFVPVGPRLDFESGHDRDRLPGGPPPGLRE
ncbi:glutathione S-transferase family protein [Natrarchaeobius oligotrophus]|uniref:Glutathione S-transferase family protein n=1 Tax=Natrarchaeobius chitinivorans TaxID=1679083 RepID=A0A3N6MEX0_NATCH|nr:glutathione S-transferase family protein [Natrarchaeobius chitinivorans]RQG99424.1 glutathione S-transferase family protein [Natrarchaeobius chitinivorans]